MVEYITYTADDEEPECGRCDNINASDKWCMKNCGGANYWNGYKRTAGKENEAKIIIEGFLGDDEVINEALEMAVKALEEFKVLKENQRNCKDCAGCTVWKCDCANIRAEVIDEFVEKVKGVYHFTILELEELNEIAEQMKGSEVG